MNFLCGPGVFDWSESRLIVDVRNERKEFQVAGSQSFSFYKEAEVYALISKIKNNGIQEEEVAIIFKKAFQTLAELMTYMNQHVLFPMITKKYKSVNLENTVKLLMRCKQLLEARKLAFRTVK